MEEIVRRKEAHGFNYKLAKLNGVFEAIMPRNERYPKESPGAARQRIAMNKAQDQATKGEMMGEGYEGGPMTRGRRRKPGYNFTRNLGNKPDMGY